MSESEFQVRSRRTGEHADAVRLAEPLFLGDVDDPQAGMRVEAGATLILAAGRHGDWPESRLVDNVFGPHEAAQFESAYEIVTP